MGFQIKPVGGKQLLYVMAAVPEYGVHLQQRFQPLMTGIGPVEAGVVLSATLAELALRDNPPDLVVSLGSAGSPTLEHTGVYQARSVSYRDMDASALGFEKGCTPLLDLPAEIDLPLRVPGLEVARLSTGANVVSGAAYANIDADMVDMESFAVLRACQRFDVPLIALRGISDGADDVTHLDDWTEYLHVVDEKLAAVVDRLEAAVVGGLLVA